MFPTTIISAFSNNVNRLVETEPFILTEEVLAEFDITVSRRHMPQEGRTGRSILVGKVEMEFLQKAWDVLINFQHFKQLDDLARRHYQWHGHVTLDQSIKIRLDMVRYEPAIGCINVWWDCSLVDADSGNVLCSYQRCQRWYTE
jgi:hypothetical protein